MSSLYQTPRYRQVLPSSLAAKVEAKITAWESVPMTVLQRFKHNGAPEDLQGFEMVQKAFQEEEKQQITKKKCDFLFPTTMHMTMG